MLVSTQLDQVYSDCSDFYRLKFLCVICFFQHDLQPEGQVPIFQLLVNAANRVIAGNP